MMQDKIEKEDNLMSPFKKFFQRAFYIISRSSSFHVI